ncbi:hypothetical protein Dimus_039825 [Dionaea muscipula]
MSNAEGSSSTPIITPNSDDVSTQPSQPTMDASVDVDDGLEKECEVILGGKYRSEVWRHFTQIKLGGVVVKAKCKYCNKLLKAEFRNGTTALKDHKLNCKRKPGALDTRQKVLLSNFLNENGKRSLESYSFDHEFARRQLANMIILHEYPLSIVEHVGFRRFVQSLQPLFKVVSRNTIKKDIFIIYEIEKKKTMQLLEDNQSRVAVTTDMWTSNQKRGFMVVTAHYIDDTWTLQSSVIRFVYVPCPHTSQVLCDALLETFASWNIDRKLATLTVDNCSSNDAMIPLLLEKLDPDSLLCGGRLFHMRCAAHILNLIVKDGLEVIKEAISLIRESVVYWTATPKREEKFEESAKQLKLSYGKKLSLDCSTRWNSTFLMLQSAIPLKDVFSRLKILHRRPNTKVYQKKVIGTWLRRSVKSYKSFMM